MFKVESLLTFKPIFMSVMTHFKILFLYLSFSHFLMCQERINGTEYLHFELKFKSDTIDFVVADTSLISKKPILLFCQGSQPVPLFVDYGERGVFPVSLNNFDVKSMKEFYHVVVISMPKTPLIASEKNLNKSYNFVTDSSIQNSYAKEYLEADYLENYVKRANHILRFLKKQDWVDNSKLVVAGHSQGSRIAVKLATVNKNISQIGLFGFNPLRRIDGVIYNYRIAAQQGQRSWEEVDSLQNQYYSFFNEFQNEELLKKEASLRSWKSFSTNSINELLSLKIPIYIANGSNDYATFYCDLLPLYFTEKEKNNLTLKRYPNLEHNFFEVDGSGNVNYSQGHWSEVMNEFIKWSAN